MFGRGKDTVPKAPTPAASLTSERAFGFASTEDAEAKILREKANALSNQIVSLIPNLEGSLAVTVATLGAAGTFGVTQNHPVILVALPFPIILLYTIVLQKNTEMLSRAGHKRFLEEEYERRTGSRLLLEELYVAPTLHGRYKVGRLSLLLMNLFQFAILVGTGALAVRALSDQNLLTVIAFYGASAVSLIMLTAALVEHQRAYKNAYRAARAAGSQERPAGTSLLH